MDDLTKDRQCKPIFLTSAWPCFTLKCFELVVVLLLRLCRKTKEKYFVNLIHQLLELNRQLETQGSF